MSEQNQQKEPATLQPYRELAEQLKSSVKEIQGFYGERDSLRSELERLDGVKQKVGDSLYEHRSNSTETTKLASKLETLDREKRVKEAQLQSLSKCIEDREQDLHQLLPNACLTFERLLSVLRAHTLSQSVANFESLVHDSFRLTYQQEILTLAEHSIQMLDIQDISVPSATNWTITRPNDQRQDTMRAVLDTTFHLTDAADLLLVELTKSYNPTLPPFVLGELPKPEEPLPEPLQPQLDTDYLDPDVRDFALQLCQQSGKTLTNLNDQEKLVLANSIENFRLSKRH
jgi:hypothetical protein